MDGTEATETDRGHGSFFPLPHDGVAASPMAARISPRTPSHGSGDDFPIPVHAR